MGTKVADITLEELKDLLRDMVKETVRMTVDEVLSEQRRLEDEYDLRLMLEVENDDRIPLKKVEESLKRVGML